MFKNLKNNIKKINIDSQQMISYSIYLIAFVISVLTAWFDVGMDISKIFTESFIGNLCFNYAIVIIVMTVSMRNSEKKGLLKEDFLTIKDFFTETLNQIRTRKLNTIFQCYTKYRSKKDRQEEIEKRMFQLNIPMETLNKSNEEIENLYKSNVIGRTQYKFIMRIKKGKYVFKAYDANDILKEYTDKATSSDDLEEHRNAIIISRAGTKMITMFAISAIFTSAYIKGSTSVGEFTFYLAARLITYTMAILSGFLIGVALINDKKNVLQNKDKFCNDFLIDFDSGKYTPTEEEMESTVLNKIKEMSFKNIEDPKDTSANSKVSDENILNEEEIELTEEELQSIIDKRNASAD